MKRLFLIGAFGLIGCGTPEVKKKNATKDEPVIKQLQPLDYSSFQPSAPIDVDENCTFQKEFSAWYSANYLTKVKLEPEKCSFGAKDKIEVDDKTIDCGAERCSNLRTKVISESVMLGTFNDLLAKHPRGIKGTSVSLGDRLKMYPFPGESDLITDWIDQETPDPMFPYYRITFKEAIYRLQNFDTK